MSILDRIASVLDRRFVLVAFLPTFMFGAAWVVVLLIATGYGGQAWEWWVRQSGTTQVLLALGALSATWLAAAFVDNQLRLLTQLFEGYFFRGFLLSWIGKCSAFRHETLLRQHVEEESSEQNAPEFEDPALPSQDDHNFREDLYVLYPRVDEGILPTRFGNIIRAAEEYGRRMYGADYLLVWPRLAHMCSERFVIDYERDRASVDFLLVVSALSAVFSVVASGTVLLASGPVLLFALSAIGGAALAHVAYLGAVSAAKEYGEQIRASMDLFRLELLRQLRFPEPRAPREEERYWAELESFVRYGEPRTRPYARKKGEGAP